MAMDGDAVWVASGPHVTKHIRGKEVRFEDHCSKADAQRKKPGFTCYQSIGNIVGLHNNLRTPHFSLDRSGRSNDDVGYC